MTDYMKEIRALHAAKRMADAKFWFTVGDKILRAVIQTDLTKNDIINKIIEDLGPGIAYNRGAYHAACQMASTFTKGQRAVLIKRGVSTEKCVTLASKRYDEGQRRVRTIAEIKSGKLKAPWKCIKAFKPVEFEPRSAPEIDHAVDTDFRIPRAAEDDDVTLDPFASMMSVWGPEKFIRLYKAAAEKLNKSGHQKWPAFAWHGLT